MIPLISGRRRTAGSPDIATTGLDFADKEEGVHRLLPILIAALLGAALLLQDEHGGAVLRTVQVGIGPTAMAVDEATGRVFISSGALNDSVQMLDATSGLLLRHVSLPPITSEALGGTSAISPGAPGEIVIHRPDDTSVSLDARTGVPLLGGNSSRRSLLLVPGTRLTGAVTFDRTANQLIAAMPGRGIAWRLPLPPGSYPLAISTRLQRIYLGTADGGVELVDAATGRVLGAADVPSPSTDQGRVTLRLAVSARTGHLFVLRSFEGGATLAMLDARNGLLLRAARNTAAYIQLAAYFSWPRPLCYVDDRGGKLFVAGLGDDALRIYSTHDGRLIRTIALVPHPAAWAIDPIRRLLLVASAGRTIGFDYPVGPGSLSAIDLLTGTLRRTLSVGAEPIAVAVDPRTARAFVLNANVNPDFTPLMARRRAAWWTGPLGWLSKQLPFLPRPGAVDAGSVTVVDTSRL